MKRLLRTAVFGAGLSLAIYPAAAIDVQPATFGGAAANIGAEIVDGLDIVVKPCDCEAPPNPGRFFAFTAAGGYVEIHYEDVEGTTIATTDGVVIGSVIAVQNLDTDGAIILVVTVPPGVLGTVTRINVRRTGFYWTGEAAIINTTYDDLRASLQSLGVGA
jgi:hypothetical protein